MPLTRDYTEKFDTFQAHPLYASLDVPQKEFLREISFRHRFTFQEFRQVLESYRDLGMWGEFDFQEWWESQVNETFLEGRELKTHLLKELRSHVEALEKKPTRYSGNGRREPPATKSLPVVSETTDKKIFGMCPVASPKTLCCNLHTIDAVLNCSFGCTYCTIQTFYQDKAIFDQDFHAKLADIELDLDRFYHIGTGQSSDSLIWGNRNGILDSLCKFAKKHSNIVLELKTKSDNIRYFLDRPVPNNVVCSWSLNTPVIIENEEHFTASLDRRIWAARQVADRGIRVAFHFHPMIYYEGWAEEYPAIADRLIEGFDPEEVAFISFGSLTLIKPVIQKIRFLGQETKILQTDFVKDPHGKLTYPDEVKIRMFKKIYESFAPWQRRVFLYLCMEKASIWEDAFGYAYEDNEEFEKAFEASVRPKLCGDVSICL